MYALLQYHVSSIDSYKSYQSGWDAGPLDAVQNIPSILIKEWGNCLDADDYVYNVLFKSIGRDDLDHANICTVWRQQVALVSGYASELDMELQTMHNTRISVYHEVTYNFHTLCSRTGSHGIRGITNFKQYIELMSVSGLLHGCMNSVTRLNITAPMVSLLNPTIPYFTVADIRFIVMMFRTMIGMTADRSVYSHRIPFHAGPYNLIKVFQKYTGFSNVIKAKYYEKLVESETIFKHFGWILTDHGPDGLDGKQYTLSAYI